MALPLFSATLFLSAFVLFGLQPMIGKMILRPLGGTPQVWNTCMMFFQMVLLAGYSYAHVATTKLTFRRHLAVQCGLLLTPLLLLVLLSAFGIGPFDFSGFAPTSGGNPILLTLGYLTMLVGLPFFVVSTTSPLLQRWFSHTDHPAAKDPYFLSIASNFGSLLGLLLYPFLIEWALGLHEQALTWWGMYVVVMVLIMACAATVWNAPVRMDIPEPAPVQVEIAPQQATPPAPAPAASQATGITRKKFSKGRPGPATTAPTPSIAKPDVQKRPDQVTWFRRLRWVGLAAAPSSLMLGVVTYICTDLSPIPLLWVIPLALYLVAFILAFARWPVVWTELPHRILFFLQPILILVLCYVLLSHSGFSPVGHITIAISAFFATALFCHGELAVDRPSAKYLTEFWLWVSVGGAVGGIFNGLVAPVVFWGVVEFPIAMVLGLLCRPQMQEGSWIGNLVDNYFPNLAGWFRNKGDEIARSRNRPEPHTTHVLEYALDVILPVLLGGFILLFIYLAVNQWGWRNRADINPLFKFWRQFVKEPRLVSFLFKNVNLVDATYSFFNLMLPMFICFLCFNRPVRLGLGVAALLWANMGYESATDRNVIYASRSYFGVLRVRTQVDEIGVSHYLMHATTHHGLNYQKEPYRRMATTYYHQYGPAGVVMLQYNWFKDGYRWQLENLKRQDDLRKKLETEKSNILKRQYEKEIEFLTEDLTGTGAQEKWRATMVQHDSDNRMPVAAIGAAAADLVGGLPLASLANLWSEPPYATIGLGTGTMASYGRLCQHVHYYEIDSKIRRLNIPEVERGDKEEPYFNYVMDAKKRDAEVQVRMGDARLRMAFPYAGYSEADERNGVGKGGGPDNFYHMMVVDAFSSDAIPIHLITKEAIEMYFTKLTEEGILCVHTSNRHVDLVPVVQSVAKSITKYDKEGLICRRGHDMAPLGANAQERNYCPGEFQSEWVMVARKKEYLDKLITPPLYSKALKANYTAEGIDIERIEARDPTAFEYWTDTNWEKLGRDFPGLLARPWTDDYSNVLSVFRWR